MKTRRIGIRWGDPEPREPTKTVRHRAFSRMTGTYNRSCAGSPRGGRLELVKPFLKKHNRMRSMVLWANGQGMQACGLGRLRRIRASPTSSRRSS